MKEELLRLIDRTSCPVVCALVSAIRADDPKESEWYIARALVLQEARGVFEWANHPERIWIDEVQIEGREVRALATYGGHEEEIVITLPDLSKA